MKSGQIAILGDHRLACGDARDKELIKKLVGDDHIHVIAADVPYGVAIVESKQCFTKSGNHRVIANDQLQSEQEYRSFTKEWLVAVTPLLAKKNSIYIFNADKMVFALRDGMHDAGVKFSQLLIWVKTQAVVGRLDYLPQHELIAYGWRGTHVFRKSKDKSVLIHPRPSKNKHHPTMKPVGLMRQLILNSSHSGDVVYDGFGGSGQTLLACEQTKRKCLMVELDPHYCGVIIDRWQQLTGLKVSYVKD